MPEDTPAAAPAATPPPAAAPPAAAPDRDAEKWIPISRFNEVNTAAQEAKAARAAAEARAADLERKVGRLELRADLGIDDDDDADRVLMAFEKAHADVKADKRPKARDWVKADGVIDTLPKSIRAAYGAQWSGAPAAAAPPGRPAAPPAAPSTSRGTTATPSTAPKGDPAAGLSPADAAAAWRRLTGR
jgi:hypothetical protein